MNPRTSRGPEPAFILYSSNVAALRFLASLSNDSTSTRLSMHMHSSPYAGVQVYLLLYFFRRNTFTSGMRLQAPVLTRGLVASGTIVRAFVTR